MVVQLSKPYDAEETKRMMQRAQYIPRPQDIKQKEDPIVKLAQTAGESAVGKVADAALFGGEAGAALGMGKQGILAKGITGLTKGAGAAKAAASGAGAAGTGMMAALASNPIGWAIGLGMLGKSFGLFNKGGAVGPLSPQYKEPGGKIPFEKRPHNKEEEFKRKYEPSMVDKMLSLITGKSIDQQAIDAKVHTAMTNYYGTPYYNRLMLEHIYPSPTNKNIGGQYIYSSDVNRPSGGMIDMITSDADDMSFRRPRFNYPIHAGPLADDKREMVKRMERGQGFNKGGDVQYKEHGGMTESSGPLSNNKSVKMEKKETIEYKN